MAVRELATNAAKHGALSRPAGRVSVSWRLEGGPPVPGTPVRRGFGSRVLDATVRGQLGGAVSLAREASGLACDMEVPLARTAAAAEEALPALG